MAGTPITGWRRSTIWVALRIGRNVGRHMLVINAAGIGFFGMLAAFPAMAAFVSLYALLSNPEHAVRQFSFFRHLMPSEVWQLFDAQLVALTRAPGMTLSVGAVFGVLVTLWSAGAGVRALITALNVVYMEPERRNLLRFYLVAAGFTVAVLGLGTISLTTIVVTPILLRAVDLGSWSHDFIAVIRWPIFLGTIVAVLAFFYKYGPSRRPPKFVWTLPGALFASLGWIAASLLFSVYVSSFARYNETYGTLGAVAILLTWFYISSLLVLLGGELNAALEQLSSADTTEGPPMPKGFRGARVADAAPGETVREPTPAEAGGHER